MTTSFADSRSRGGRSRIRVFRVALISAQRSTFPRRLCQIAADATTLIIATPEHMATMILKLGALFMAVVVTKAGAAMSYASSQRCFRGRSRPAIAMASTQRPPKTSVRRLLTFIIMRRTQASPMET